MFSLKADTNYTIVLEIRCMDGCHYHYTNSKWIKRAKSNAYEAVTSAIPSWTHPDNPNTGQFWMEDPVSFQKAKLTNNAQIMSTVHTISSAFQIEATLSICRSFCSK